MSKTTEQISNFFSKVQRSLEQANKDIASTDTKSIKDSLYSYTDKAQAQLNKLLSKAGVITDQEINELDEQLRIAKKEIELQKAKQTQNRFLITTAIIATAIVGLWYITKKR